MIIIKRLIALVLFLGITIPFFGQMTTVFTEANQFYKEGIEYFDKGLYPDAVNYFEKTLTLIRPINEPKYDLLQTKAELGIARSSVRMNAPNGEAKMLSFIRKHTPDPIANQALIEVADYYFNAKKYEKAVHFFSMIPTYELTREQRAAVLFKEGYAYFVRKKFAQAKSKFEQVKNIENDYFFPTNYYYGLCEFYNHRYDEAVKSFKIVDKSKKYKKYIPYYIAQIYFGEKKYDELIKYVEPKLKMSGIRKTKELHQLLGQAYFEKGDYDQALPHLEYYVSRSGKLRPEEFYQLGFAQFKTGHYKQAIKNFKQLRSANSELGQNALYNLAICYLKTKNKTGARSAFGDAAMMDYNATIREESQFNYAKLSYELGFDKEAILAAQAIRPGAKYYSDAQNLLSTVFMSTNNYKKALATIESMPTKTPQMKKAYQRVAYLRGLELMKAGNTDEAKKAFKKSLDVPVDQKTKALAIYRLGDIAYTEKKYQESINYLNQFQTLAKIMRDLPDDASIHTANYLQGYNYIKQEKYTSALGYFKDAVAGIKRNSMYIKSDVVKKDILGDATMRTGDCYFKRNKKKSALKFYNEAIRKGYRGFVYAVFQKAMILGLEGDLSEKISALDRIVTQYPKSKYADDALFHMSRTYIEQGKKRKALKPLERLVDDYPNSNLYNKAHIQLGMLHYQVGETNEAIRYLKKIFKHSPTNEESREALTLLQEIYIEDLNQPDEYAAFLETIPGYKLGAIERDSINFRAGDLQYENQNYEQAISSFSKYIRKFPNGVNILKAHFYRGDCYSILKQYDKALVDNEYIINLGPGKYYLQALREAAVLADKTGDCAKSLKYYEKLEKAVTDSKDKLNAQLGALHCAYKLNQEEKAKNLALKVFNNPDATKEQKSNSKFFIGKLAYKKKQYDEALKHLNYVIKNSDNVNTAEARYLISEIYYLGREFSLAEKMCLEANAKNGNHEYWTAKSIILLSDIYVEQNEFYRAKGALNAILKKYKGDQELINIAKIKLANVEKLIEQNNRLETENLDNFMEEDSGN